ncbi:MAG: RpiB/LacA/LacB family sugar-phosphate isomerase [Minisyncoccia bacterium]|jgi:ribose 5-phosphate isomerase B
MKKIYIASDHAGFELKEALVPFLNEHGYEVNDLGPAIYDKDDDYPDTIGRLVRAIEDDKTAFGIAVGGSGQGEAMVANRALGVRASVYYGPAQKTQTDALGKSLGILESPRAHEDSNVLCLAARFLSQEDAKAAVIRWLETPFTGEERHVRRIQKFDQ